MVLRNSIEKNNSAIKSRSPVKERKNKPTKFKLLIKKRPKAFQFQNKPSCFTKPLPKSVKKSETTIVQEGIVDVPDCVEIKSNIKTKTSLAQEEELNVSPKTLQRVVGLQNLGNTCFMNATLQCLFYTTDLTYYVLSGTYKKHLNYSNPLGSNGKLMNSFAKLVYSIATSKVPKAPWELKGVISEVCPRFTGYRQHDGQELLASLLDGLHEDVNLIIDKPYFEIKDSNGREDQIVAQEAWENHKARNDSKIVTLFQGQLKSTITCPTCNKSSITFDPLMYLTLPLVAEDKQQIFFYKIPQLVTEPVVKCIASIDKNLLRKKNILHTEILRQLFPDVEKPENKYGMFTLTQNRSLKHIVNLYRFLNSRNSKHLIVHELCTNHQQLEEKNLINIQIMFKSNRYMEDVPSPRIWTFKHDITGTELYNIIIKRLSCLIEDPKIYNFWLDCKRVPCDKKIKIQLDFEPIPNNDEKLKFGDEMQILTVELCPMFNGHYQKIKNKYMKDFTKSSSKAMKLEDCIELNNQPEVLKPDNAWYCSHCKKKQCASKKIDIWRFPDHLIIYLKRFKKTRYGRIKINKLIEFPIHGLDLKKYELSTEIKESKYDLYAVSNHIGNLSGGHYTAYVKFENSWYYVNDASSRKIDNVKEVVSSKAYILFYKRRDST